MASTEKRKIASDLFTTMNLLTVLVSTMMDKTAN